MIEVVNMLAPGEVLNIELLGRTIVIHLASGELLYFGLVASDRSKVEPLLKDEVEVTSGAETS